MNKQTRNQHLQNKTVFCSLNSTRALGDLLKTDPQRLYLLAQQPQYKSFTIPKKGGGERQIETPGNDLKKVLARLNRYLQSVYIFEKSSAAHGFITSVKNDSDRRSIVSNAKKHLGKKNLLNLDIKDFFHSISREKVLSIFLHAPFRFRKELPDLLADLTTYKGRLPMGAPTSPTLSNFACRELDEQLINFSEQMLWDYSRYADDMTFSSNQKINSEKIYSAMAIIREHGFEVNTKKIKVYGPDDDKIVTGLLLTDRIELAPDFLEQLQKDLDVLREVVKAQHESGQLTTRWVEQLKQQVKGRINFAGFVLKKNNPEYMTLKSAYYTAISPPQEEFGAMSWRGFPYNLK